MTGPSRPLARGQTRRRRPICGPRHHILCTGRRRTAVGAHPGPVAWAGGTCRGDGGGQPAVRQCCIVIAPASPGATAGALRSTKIATSHTALVWRRRCAFIRFGVRRATVIAKNSKVRIGERPSCVARIHRAKHDAAHRPVAGALRSLINQLRRSPPGSGAILVLACLLVESSASGVAAH
jgi:hypothetical protein